MAIVSPTLSGAISRDDTAILLSALTGLAAGQLAKIDQEVVRILSVPSAATIPVPVLRGQEGTAAVAHPASAVVVAGNTATATGTDWGQSVPGATSVTPFAAGRNRFVTSYSASGALTLPTVGADAVATLNGTAALTMTLADPTKDLDGSILIVIGNGKAAHILTMSAGIGLGAGGSGVDVGTFAAGAQQAVVLMAMNGVWVPYPSFYGGSSLANVTVTWA